MKSQTKKYIRLVEIKKVGSLITYKNQIYLVKEVKIDPDNGEYIVTVEPVKN